MTWSDDLDSIGFNYSILEANFSGSATNYTNTTRFSSNISHYNASVADGRYSWRIFANDSSNIWNVTSSALVVIEVDNVAPVIVIQQPDSVMQTMEYRGLSELFWFNASITDNSAISTVIFSIDGVNGTANQFNSSSVYNISVTNLDIGNHSIIWYANDTVGNAGSNSTWISFSIPSGPGGPGGPSVPSVLPIIVPLNITNVTAEAPISVSLELDWPVIAIIVIAFLVIYYLEGYQPKSKKFKSELV